MAEVRLRGPGKQLRVGQVNDGTNGNGHLGVERSLRDVGRKVATFSTTMLSLTTPSSTRVMSMSLIATRGLISASDSIHVTYFSISLRSSWGVDSDS